jgi:diguanylate cyclase (GGDEF)-like protein
MEFPDIEILSSLQTHLASLTGLSLALYGEKGNIMLPPVNEDKLSTAIKSSHRGRKEHHEFVKDGLEKALQRNEIAFFKSPSGQCYFIVPLRIGKTVLAVVGGGVFLSDEDFNAFYKRDGLSYGLVQDHIKPWYRATSIREFSDIQECALNIRSLFHLVLGSCYSGCLNEKRHNVMKTILSLISSINPGKKATELFDILTDIPVFLFNAHSVAAMVQNNGGYEPQRTSGKLHEHLQSVPLPSTGIIAEVIEKQQPVYSESMLEILNLGFNSKVTSLHVFPVLSEGRVTGLLNIVNTELLQEDSDIIMEMCRIAGNVFRCIELQEIYEKSIKETDIIKIAASRLIPVKDPGMLCEAILDTSVHLAEAEKGSVMLADEDTSFLTIKAAKGLNKRIFGDVKIRSGEGVAGWVFREGVPLLMDNIEENNHGFEKRYRYRTSSFISIPLRLGEKTIGVLNIADKITGGVFCDEDMILLRSFASYAAIALERSSYYSLAGQLKELSITDSLTGIFNRRYFEERFFEELHRSERHNLSFSLAMLDIDDFKLFNDTEGHLAGDEILKSVANITKECLRISDVLARFGGEEFIIIMPQTEKNEAFAVAERIRQSIREQSIRRWNGFPGKCITTSIGVATFPSDGTDRKELIRNADKALYKAKMEGKDKTVLWGS